MKVFGYIVLGLIITLLSGWIAEVIRQEIGLRFIVSLCHVFFLVFLWKWIITAIKQTCSSNKAEQEIKQHAEIEKSSIEDDAHIIALDELENNQTDRLSWAKALEGSDGNENRAKSLYIRFRVEQLLKQKIEERNQK